MKLHCDLYLFGTSLYWQKSNTKASYYLFQVKSNDDGAITILT